MRPLVLCHTGALVHPRWQNRRPLPMHLPLPSESTTRIPPPHHRWTRAHPHVPLWGQSHGCCRAEVGAILLPFLKTLGHILPFISSWPQFPSVISETILSSWYPLRLFLSSKDNPALPITQRKRGEHLQPYYCPLAQKKLLSPGQIRPTVAQPIACGSHNSS